MAIQFGNEHLKLEKWERGVYKVIFNNQWFYVGSSVDLKRRLSNWKHYINSGNPKNANVRYILPIVTDVRFEIIELVEKNTDPKILEDEYIKFHLTDFDCLNMCPDAFTPVGRQKAFGQSVRWKPRGKVYECQRVAQFTKDGLFIQEFPSLTEAAASIAKDRKRSSKITAVATGKAKYFRGFVFKFVDAAGNIIDPPKFKAKTPTTVERKYKVFRTILKINNRGEVIGKYVNLTDIRKKTGIDKRVVWMVLTGKRKSSGGFSYVYEDSYTSYSEPLTLF